MEEVLSAIVTAPVKGFLDPEEGMRLYMLAREASSRGPCLEIGSYCGKSAVYLGTGCRDGGGILFPSITTAAQKSNSLVRPILTLNSLIPNG